MNFEDPFANDLNNFRSAAAALQRAGAGAGAPVALGGFTDTGGGLSSFGNGNLGSGRGNTDALAAASPVQSSPVLSGRRGTTPALYGAASPLSGGGSDSTGGTSLFPSPMSFAPVAGRRAAAASSAVPSLSATAAANSAGPNWLAQQPAVPAAPSLLVAPQPATTAPSTLSWLDDDVGETASPAPGGVKRAHEGAPQPSAAAPPLLQGGASLKHSGIPSFLNMDTGNGTSAAAAAPPAPQHQMPTTMNALTPAGTPMQNAEASAAAEAELKRKELRDLFASLDALDMELQRLDERLDTRQLKEETELLALETSVLAKTNELANREEELAARKVQLTSQTEQRLAALTRRYDTEREAQSTEVRSLDCVRFEKQLQQVLGRCTAAEQSVKQLRERAALMQETDPFSETGVRVALATSPTSEAPSTVEVTELEKKDGTPAQLSVAAGTSSPSLEAALQKAVVLLRAYCDQRLGHARKHLVDVVHTETLASAHAVRRQREQAWMLDAAHHKELFSQHLIAMMERFMTFYKQRAVLKQENISALQTELHETAAQLRSHAVTRLQKLLEEVSARITLSEERHTKSSAESWGMSQKRARGQTDADAAMAAAQRKELESRLRTEAQALRQRFHAEEDSLQEQLQRLRRSTDDATRRGFQSLEDGAVTSVKGDTQILQTEVARLKNRVEDKLRHGNRTPSSSSALLVSSSVARMHAEELAHVIERALTEEAARQQRVCLTRQRCDELRRELMLRIEKDVVEHMQRVRCVQRAHHARIDAQCRTWEAAHRQNLSAACSLILPLSGSTAGTADVDYVAETYAAPQDVASAALLGVLSDKLRSRDSVRRSLLEARKEGTSRCSHRMCEEREGQVALQSSWEGLWTAMQTQLTQLAAAHEMQLEVEKGHVAVAAQQVIAERDRRTTERQRRRMADVMRRLHTEAAATFNEDDGDGDQPLPLPFSSETCSRIDDGFASQTSPLFCQTDPNVLHRQPSANKFTAVHASTNAATDPQQAVVHVYQTTGSLPSASSASSSAAISASPLGGAGGAMAKADRGNAVAPSTKTPPVIAHAPHAVEASMWSGATLPWSSALLRAEKRLPSPSTVGDPTQQHASSVATSSASPVDEEERGLSSVYQGASSHHSSTVTSPSLQSPKGTIRSTGEDRHASDERNPSHSSQGTATTTTAATKTTEEEHRRTSTVSATPDVALLPASSATEVESSPIPQRRHRTLPLSPGQPHRHTAASRLTTWSTLDEYRSSVERFGRHPTEEETSAFNTTFSMDDGTDFVDLLSCTDSFGSSLRTYR